MVSTNYSYLITIICLHTVKCFQIFLSNANNSYSPGACINYRLGSSALEKENSEFKSVKLRLKIDLVSYHARAEGLVNMDIWHKTIW